MTKAANILVVGGAGYIGTQVLLDIPDYVEEGLIRVLDNLDRPTFIRELVEERERFRDLLNYRYADVESIKTTADLTKSIGATDESDRYEFVKGDMREEEIVDRAMRGIDIVIDLAGITTAPLSFKRRDLTLDVNVGGVRNVLSKISRSDVKKYVYASSASVYGNTVGDASEQHECKPNSPYGESKLMAEKEIRAHMASEKLNATILRLGTVFGYSPGIRYDTNVNLWVKRALEGKPIEVWETAWKERRPYLHVRDAARSLLSAATNPKTDGETFNVITQNALPNEIISVIRKHFPEVQVVTVPTPNQNLVSYALDDKKIRRLGFERKYSLDDGISELKNRIVLSVS